ncbi:MAG: hypothetical protein PHP62_03380 [Candidatus Moranbacteria bacterium]|nr:hypothetical protein [Candidatus Moranbacteria bacterium]
MKHEILLGLTTTPKSDWRGKVEEMKKFGIKKIALFPTFLKIDDRKELYKLLEDIDGLEIPHVHLRDDFKKEEMDLLCKKFKTRVFNIHSQHFLPLMYDLSQYYPVIFVENSGSEIPADYELNKFGGVCIDFSHLENARLTGNDVFEVFIEKINQYKIGCCHVSAIKKESHPDNFDIGNPGRAAFDEHLFCKLLEFDYIGQYLQYLPYYISLELENSFEEQLKAKQYLEKIINT